VSDCMRHMQEEDEEKYKYPEPLFPKSSMGMVKGGQRQRLLLAFMMISMPH